MFCRKIQSFSFIAVLLLVACVKNPESRGYAIEYSEFEKIENGMSQDQVLGLLGTPTSVSSFGDETWYYIGMKLDRRAFWNANLREQKAFHIRFNQDKKVAETSLDQGEKNRNIAFAKDKTLTEGNSVTVVEQFLGNLGRFNPNTQKTKRQVKPRF
jgi:outer membrane protein assembly factor BamE (lipoprotein component of BamABCDE complex)